MNHTIHSGSDSYIQRYNINALKGDILAWEILPGVNKNLYIEKNTINIKGMPELLKVEYMKTQVCAIFLRIFAKFKFVKAF